MLKENDRLKQEHLLLSSKLQRYEVLETENRRLRELLESSFRINDKVLVAELIAVELQSFRRQVVINKGNVKVLMMANRLWIQPASWGRSFMLVLFQARYF